MRAWMIITILATSHWHGTSAQAQIAGQTDRSIGYLSNDELDQSARFRQSHSNDVNAVINSSTGVDEDNDVNSIAIGNAMSVEVDGSALAKGKQRSEGSVRAELTTDMTTNTTGIEVKLNASAFGNVIMLENGAAQSADVRQRNTAKSVTAIVIGEIATTNPDDHSSQAVALSNSFSSEGPVSAFDGNVDQRSDADILAHNQTSGIRSNDDFQAIAIGNSISVRRE